MGRFPNRARFMGVVGTDGIPAVKVGFGGGGVSRENMAASIEFGEAASRWNSA